MMMMMMMIVVVKSRVVERFGEGVANFQNDCPCEDASLCDPVKREGLEDVYAFHTAGAANWEQYDWDQLTTICVFGTLDPKMLCYAHSKNVRVTVRDFVFTFFNFIEFIFFFSFTF